MRICNQRELFCFRQRSGSAHVVARLTHRLNVQRARVVAMVIPDRRGTAIDASNGTIEGWQQPIIHGRVDERDRAALPLNGFWCGAPMRVPLAARLGGKGANLSTPTDTHVAVLSAQHVGANSP
jgi:hypothetical protein